MRSPRCFRSTVRASLRNSPHEPSCRTRPTPGRGLGDARAHAGAPSHTTPYGVFEVGAKIGLAAGEVSGASSVPRTTARAAFYFRGPAIDACAEAEQRGRQGRLMLHPSAHPSWPSQVAAEPVERLPACDGVRRASCPNRGPWRCRPLTPTDPRPASIPPHIIEQTSTGEFRQAINVFIGLECDRPKRNWPSSCRRCSPAGQVRRLAQPARLRGQGVQPAAVLGCAGGA